MNIRELIGQLESAAEDMGDETEIRIAMQPSWPLRGVVKAVTVPDEDERPHCDEHIMFVQNCAPCRAVRDEVEANGEDKESSDGPTDRKFLWLAIDQVSSYSENPYAPRWAWDGSY